MSDVPTEPASGLEVPADAPTRLAHTWAERWLASLKITTCSVCGAVKRRGDQNPACRGPARIDLRRTR